MSKPTTKPTICLTCHSEVEMRFNETTRVYEPFEPGTTKRHVCVEPTP